MARQSRNVEVGKATQCKDGAAVLAQLGHARLVETRYVKAVVDWCGALRYGRARFGPARQRSQGKVSPVGAWLGAATRVEAVESRAACLVAAGIGRQRGAVAVGMAREAAPGRARQSRSVWPGRRGMAWYCEAVLFRKGGVAS